MNQRNRFSGALIPRVVNKSHPALYVKKDHCQKVPSERDLRKKHGENTVETYIHPSAQRRSSCPMESVTTMHAPLGSQPHLLCIVTCVFIVQSL